jgi:ankyrin repeat protein
MSRPLTPAEISELQRRYGYLVNYQADDPDAPIDPVTYRDSDNDSLLHIAARNGDRCAVELLLEAGVDANLLGDMGSTPLHYAKEKQHSEVAKLLIEHGAREDIRNEFGKTP